MDKSAILPDGSNFPFWEAPVEYERELHVNRNHPMADDTNEGTLEKPLATINAAAQLLNTSAAPGVSRRETPPKP